MLRVYSVYLALNLSFSCTPLIGINPCFKYSHGYQTYGAVHNPGLDQHKYRFDPNLYPVLQGYLGVIKNMPHKKIHRNNYFYFLSCINAKSCVQVCSTLRDTKLEVCCFLKLFKLSYLNLLICEDDNQLCFC